MCASYRHHSQADYPQKKPTRIKPHKRTLMLLHRCDQRILLWRRPPSGIWGGLWSLPEVDDASAIELWQQSFLVQTQSPSAIQRDVIRHQFSHYSLDISLAIIELEQISGTIADGENYTWVEIDSFGDYGLPTPVRKILAMLE